MLVTAIFKNTIISVIVFISCLSSCNKIQKSDNQKDVELRKAMSKMLKERGWSSDIPLEEKEEIRKAVRPRLFKTLKEFENYLDSLDRVFPTMISEEEYKKVMIQDKIDYPIEIKIDTTY